MNFPFAGWNSEWNSKSYSFYDRDMSTEFWSSSEANVTDAYSRGLAQSRRDGDIMRFADNKTDGYSVRCIEN